MQLRDLLSTQEVAAAAKVAGDAITSRDFRKMRRSEFDDYIKERAARNLAWCEEHGIDFEQAMAETSVTAYMQLHEWKTEARRLHNMRNKA